MSAKRLAVRWTIGDVSERGWEALRLSVWGAWRCFGPAARYVVCVNTVPLDEAQARAGDLPRNVGWYDNTGDVPAWLLPHLAAGMAEGVAWKLAPVRLFPDCWELSLDNECILWALPRAVRDWLRGDGAGDRCVVAQDVARAYGRFGPIAPREAWNGRLRGLPPVEGPGQGYDHEAAMLGLLERTPGAMTSELDEQGLQAAAMGCYGDPLVVTNNEVTICSPWPPHVVKLGLCGAHFVGVNARELSWAHDGRNAVEYTKSLFDYYRRELYARTGAPPRRSLDDARMDDGRATEAMALLA